ncbi:archaeosine synthase subunit alpha [Halococcus sp. AFM35]|uniref:archaeosine synthase subunit alpha n=1 Tax=Halococcus sp. AFM35 TaxID=3421653 RepID=UPI003EBF948B
MTDFFEVHDRDGPARIGELRLTESLTTPALVGDRLSDAGSLWPESRETPTGDSDSLTVLPHRALPAGTPDEVESAFAVDSPSIDGPSAAVISSGTAAECGSDAYVLSDAQGLVGHARAFVEGIVDVKNAIPDDTALYLPGVATPANVGLLAYAGVDLFDADRVVVKGTQGKYLTSDGEQFLADLDELPCACPACQQTREEFDREDCAAHNEHALAAQLATVRGRIRRGRLRDYLEGQGRHEAWLTAALRRFDQQYAYLEAHAPVFRRNELLAASEESLRRVEIQRFAERVTTRYRNRFSNPLVLVPCSATKPYSESQSHGQFHDAIQFRAHTVSMTSPIGVVPQELECTYPAQHYDSVVTGEWSAGEVEFVSSVLEAYLARNDYPRVVAHVPAEYRQITERVEESMGIEFEYTVRDHPTTSESLSNLAGALDGELKYAKREREHNTVRALADYQFGPAAGDDLFTDITVEGRYPKLRVHDDEHLATMVPQYGTLAFTLAGARRWVDSDAPVKIVEIDEFVPHGSVLAPGIVGADERIRVGDEVVVRGPKAFAVGRATMNGRAMAGSSRGVAVDVRHVEER